MNACRQAKKKEKKHHNCPWSVFGDILFDTFCFYPFFQCVAHNFSVCGIKKFWACGLNIPLWLACSMSFFPVLYKSSTWAELKVKIKSKSNLFCRWISPTVCLSQFFFSSFVFFKQGITSNKTRRVFHFLWTVVWYSNLMYLVSPIPISSSLQSVSSFINGNRIVLIITIYRQNCYNVLYNYDSKLFFSW